MKRILTQTRLFFELARDEEDIYYLESSAQLSPKTWTFGEVYRAPLSHPDSPKYYRTYESLFLIQTAIGARLYRHHSHLSPSESLNLNIGFREAYYLQRLAADTLQHKHELLDASPPHARSDKAQVKRNLGLTHSEALIQLINDERLPNLMRKIEDLLTPREEV